MKKLIFSLLVLGQVALNGQLMAASGDLDSSFDTDGIVTTTFDDLFPNASAVNSAGRSVIYLSNGQILVGGSVNTLTTSDIASFFSLTRYNADGSLDSSFGTNGRIITDFSSNFPNTTEAYVLSNSGTIQRPDGNFVSAGIALIDEGTDTFFDYVVAVYNPDGSLDSSFNPSGALPGTLYFRLNTTSGSILGGATAVAAQSDNKILLSGIGGGPSVVFDFTTIRLNTDGSFDTSFNATGSIPGVSNVEFGSSSADVALSILYNPNNDQILTGGTTLVDIPSSLDLAYALYDSAGGLLPSFGSGGLQAINLGGGTSASQVNALGLQSNGQVVSAGTHNTGFALTRLLSDGSLDPNFGNSGAFFTDLLVGVNFIQDSADMAVADDDRLFVTGSNNGDFAFIKVLADGSSLDTNFNAAGANPGFVSTDIGNSDRSNGIALQADGKILVVGTSNAGGADNQTLVRYLGNTADLSISKTTDGFSFIGGPVTFDIAVSNAGPDTAEGVVVTDALPSGLNFVSASSSQGSCSGTETITCQLGDIASGASASVTIDVVVAEANVYENTATVSAQVVDPDSANNSSTATVTALVTQGGACSVNPRAGKTASALGWSLPLILLFVLRRPRFFLT